MLLNTFREASNQILIPQPERDIARKTDSYRSISLRHTEAKICNKIVANRIQWYIQSILHHGQVRFIPEMQQCFNICKSVNKNKSHMIISRDAKKLLIKIFNIMKVVFNFPGGTVDNNLSADAGDTGSRRFHMSRATKARKALRPPIWDITLFSFSFGSYPEQFPSDNLTSVKAVWLWSVSAVWEPELVFRGSWGSQNRIGQQEVTCVYLLGAVKDVAHAG